MRTKTDSYYKPKSLNREISCYKEFQEWLQLPVFLASRPELMCIISLLGHHVEFIDPEGSSSPTYSSSSASLYNSVSTFLYKVTTPKNLYIHKMTFESDCHNSSQMLTLNRIKTWLRLILIETLNNYKNILWAWSQFSTKTALNGYEKIIFTQKVRKLQYSIT